MGHLIAFTKKHIEVQLDNLLIELSSLNIKKFLTVSSAGRALPLRRCRWFDQHGSPL